MAIFNTVYKHNGEIKHYVFDFTSSVENWTLWNRLSFTQWTGITRNWAWAGGNQYAYYNNDLDIDWSKVRRIAFKAVLGWNTLRWNSSTTVSISKDRIMSWQTSDSSCFMKIQYDTQTPGNYGYWDTNIISNLEAITYEEDIAIYDFANLTTSFYRNWTLLVNGASMDATKVASLKAANNQVLWIAMDNFYYKYLSLIDLLIELYP